MNHLSSQELYKDKEDKDGQEDGKFRLLMGAFGIGGRERGSGRVKRGKKRDSRITDKSNI